MSFTRHAKLLIGLTYVLLVVYSLYHLIIRYLDNKDASAIDFHLFNHSPNDNYPAFTICLYGTNGKMYTSFENELKTEFGISASEYEMLLKGKKVGEKGIQDISNIDHERFAFKLQEFLHRAKYETHNKSEDMYYGGENNGDADSSFSNFPLYISHKEPDTTCYTRITKFVSGNFRKNDKLILLLEKMTNQTDYHSHFQIYIHHPGQLTRVFKKPNFESYLGDITNLNNYLSMRISRVSVLRRRPDANLPCAPKLDDDEMKLRMEITKVVGCFPPYWKYMVSNNSFFGICNTSKQLAAIYHYIDKPKRIMATYKPPCSHMAVNLNLQRQSYSHHQQMYIQFVYMDEHYQQITNVREIGLGSFWSNTGGFIGLYLGYSLFQIPEIIGKVWDGIKKHIEQRSAYNH